MKMTRFIVVALAVLCFVVVSPLSCATANPQQQVSPEQMKGLMEVMFKGMIEVLASPEMANSLATFYRNLYQALMAKGFTKEEALQIVISQGNIFGSGQK